MDQFHEKLRAMHVAPNMISLHQRRIQQDQQPIFKILDTCRLENHGILTLPDQCDQDTQQTQIAAFVPAAGAASRFRKPFARLEETLQSADEDGFLRELSHLKAQGAEQWPLPAELRRWLTQNGQERPKWDSWQREQILQALDQPKALFPAVLDGTSFLEMKILEHQALNRIKTQFFVCSPESLGAFKKVINNTSPKIETHLFEQGNPLSTLRFDTNGEPVAEPDGMPSLVPGGHGTLNKLFPQVHQHNPNIEALFIRNIDNVNGTQASIIKATQAFFQAFDFLLGKMKHIRTLMAQARWSTANQCAAELIQALGINSAQQTAEIGPKNSETGALWTLQHMVFHTPAADSNPSTLLRLFKRPLNVLGQVRNSGKDVGGTPVWAETPLGKAKLCIEVPHASPEDQQRFLANPERATHFNPVFCLTELRSDFEYPYDHPFWLIARKQYHGQDVSYHEELLYEIIGNSCFSNLLFVEIPRSLFSPHKSISDGAGQRLRDWISAEPK